MFTFTDDQRMALEFPGNVIVSAGAGSGKTRVLVEKYFRLLVDEHPDWPVDSVVAITFTRKAAAELKARIIRRVLGELEAETQEGPRRSRLRELRSEVGAAPIGTIHNFCGRILKEFAFDARLDPDYVVLEGAQEGALRLQAARETIAEITAMNCGQLYTDLLSLLNMLSASKVTEMLASLLANRTTYLEPAKRYEAMSTDELYNDLVLLHKDVVGNVRKDFARKWHAVLSELVERAQPGKVYDAAAAALAQWPEVPEEDWTSCEATIAMALEGLLTKTNTCRKREFSQAGFEEFDAVRDTLEQLCVEYKKAILSDLDEGDRFDLERTQKLARLFLHAADNYAKLRGGERDQTEAQMVDFSDLELLAHKLVQSSSQIRRQLRSKYPFLIVDEFQDTSQSQWDILKPLVTNEEGELRRNCLFVVGDRKQGVYGFRDANVQLFSQVQQLVASSNMEWNGSLGLVSMSANFRTNPTPLTFINRVFENLLSEAGNVYGVEFEALTPMRNETPGCVEFLLATGESTSADDAEPEKLNADEQRQAEARLVAAHIKCLIDNGEAKPAKIALLFRKKSGFYDYEAALRELGIPCVVQQGLNLFQQPELADIGAALNAVVYPHRDLVFVHYLRSPFIGFSDNLLLKIARTRGRSYWDKANKVLAEGKFQLDDKWYPITEQETERLSFALGLLERTRGLVGRVSPYDVVKSMVEELGVATIVLAGYRGEQAAANIEKLLQVARSAENLNFEDFLEYIKSEEQSLQGTAEAVDLTTADAVKIMTIHAAKGLEFPVVYLPSLNSGTSGRMNDVNSDGNFWMTLRLAKGLIEKPSFLANYFSLIAQQQSNAEERRIFYVAMTRCEQRLILCANHNTRARGDTFYNWIANEFERGKSEKLLKRTADFPALTADVTDITMPVTSPQTRISRGAKVEAALRAADIFNKLTRMEIVAVAPPPDPLSDLVIRFLRLCLSKGTDSAWNTLKREVELRVTRDQVDVWQHRLQRAGEWVLSLAEHDTVRFLPVIRLASGRSVQTIRPDIGVGNRIGWVVLDGTSPARATYECERYKSAASDIKEAPEAHVWLINSDLEEVCLS